MLILQAVAPLVLLILAGMALAWAGGLDEPRRRALDWLLFHVLMPAFIVSRLATALIDPRAVLDLLVAVSGVVLVVGTTALLIRVPISRALGDLSGPTFTSFLQGLIRNNFFIPMALVETASGSGWPAALPALMAIATVLNILPATALSVMALTRFGHPTGNRPQAWHRALLTNPLLLAALLGATLSASGIGLAGPIEGALKLLGDGVLGLALLAVGAGLRLPSLPAARRVVLASAPVKLVAMPLLGLAAARLMGADPATCLAALLLHAAPTAAGSYILARQLGGDAETMAAIISLQTAACIATIPLLLWLLPIGP